jgi:uncharacterized protein (TIGR03067 family)
MRLRLLALLAVVAGLAADAPKDDAKKDQDKLQGEWTLMSGERDGNAFPDDLVKSLKRTMKDDHFSITRDGETLAKGTFKLDPSKKPKAIDIKLDNNDTPVQGIYELDGDTFKMCYAAPGEARPSKFAAEAGTGHTYAVWKRVKK